MIDNLSQLPSQLREAIAGLSEAQLNARYCNRSIRQIVHHLADSHINSYVRFKWALTEYSPKIKAYDERLWSELGESQTGDIELPMLLLEGLHARWVQLLRSMSDADFNRTFVQPESGEMVSMNSDLASNHWESGLDMSLQRTRPVYFRPEDN